MDLLRTVKLMRHKCVITYLENTFENTLDECDGWLDSADDGNEDSLSSFSPAIFSIHASGYDRRFSI